MTGIGPSGPPTVASPSMPGASASVRSDGPSPRYMSTVGGGCETCGKAFGTLNPRGRRRRFCDARCRSKARRQRTPRPSGNPAAQPFPTAVRAAIANSGRSLRDLASQLEAAGYPLSASTLSQWGAGHHRPRLNDDVKDRLFALERLAWVPTGSLVRALLLDTPGHPQVRRTPRVPRPRGSDGRPWQRTTVEARELLLQRIGSLFGSDPHALTQVAYTEHHVIDCQHLPVRSEITITVAAVTGTPDRYWHIHTTHERAPFTVVAGAGCTRGIALDAIRPVRVNSRTTHQLAATELRLDRPLAAGGEHTFSFTVHYGSDAAPLPELPELPEQLEPPAEVWALVPTPAMRELRVSIAFDPAAPPRRLSRVHWPLRPAAAHPNVATVPVDEDGGSESIRAGFPTPGWYGYQWDRPTAA